VENTIRRFYGDDASAWKNRCESVVRRIVNQYTLHPVQLSVNAVTQSVADKFYKYRSRDSMSSSTAFYLIVTILMTSSSQVLQKHAANHSNSHSSETSRILKQPSFIGSIVLLGLGLCSWIMVLKHTDVSLAYPLLSINFIVVLAMSKMIFKEKIGRTRCLGCFLILAGVYFLSGAAA